MKILYVILSCEKHLDTRVKWQRETWLKGIEDVVYLDKPMGEETYLNVPKKYVEFLKNYHSNYEWLFFCDDDTFVYTKKLELLLSAYSQPYPFIIGYKLGDFTIAGTNIQTTCCSGGAGIAISNPVIKNMQHYLRTENVIITPESDTSLAVWYKLSTPDFMLIDRKDLFNPRPPTNMSNGNFITYHYCQKQHFEFLNSVNK